MKKKLMREEWSGSLEVGSLGRLTDQDSIDRLNRELDKVNYGQSLNPYSCINKIRNILALAGLSFDDLLHLPFTHSHQDNRGGNTKSNVVVDTNDFKSGTLVLALKQFGGPTGMNKEGEWHDEDGVSNKVAGGLSLSIYYTKSHGVWTMSAKVVTGNKDVSDAVLGEKSLGECNDSTMKVKKEELDPVRDIASRKGIVGKIKGLARDVTKKYKANQAASQTAAKQARKDMGLRELNTQRDFGAARAEDERRKKSEHTGVKSPELEHGKFVPGVYKSAKTKLQENPAAKEYKSLVKGLGTYVANQVVGAKTNHKQSKYINLGVGKKKKFSSVVHEPAPNLPEEQKLLLGDKKKKADDSIHARRYKWVMKQKDSSIQDRRDAWQKKNAGK